VERDSAFARAPALIVLMMQGIVTTLDLLV
jgi:hypothetical protein